MAGALATLMPHRSWRLRLGLLGAIVGPWYIQRSRESRERIAALGRLIERGGDTA